MNNLPNIKKSYIYVTISQIVNAIYPLLTVPYIARVLGPEVLGKVNFSLSLVQYFITFSSLGIILYGAREISKVRDNNEEVNRVFSELFSLVFLSTTVSSILYLLLFIFIDKIKSDPYLYLIMGMGLFFNQMAVSWFFVGTENFKYISIRNVLFKILMIFLIFISIKSQEDYLIYSFLLSLSLFGTNILDFTLALKYVKVKITFSFLKHLRPLIIFFLSGILSVFYSGTEVITLGFILGNEGDKAVGIFTISKRTVSLILFIIGALMSVNFSRISYIVSKDNKEEYKHFFLKTSNFIMLISTFVSTMTFILSKEILLIIGGKDFVEGEICLKILSLVGLLTILRSILESNVIIPYSKEKTLLITQILSWTTMMVVCIITIQKYSYIGASIGLLIGTLTSLTIFIVASIKTLEFNPITKEMLTYFALSIVIVISHSVFQSTISKIPLLGNINTVTEALLFCSIVSITYGIIYTLLLIILRDKSLELVIKTLLQFIPKYLKK